MTLLDLIKYKDSNTQLDIIILEVSKALNIVFHDRLLYKLRYYGKTGNILNWIFVFLKQRELRVLVECTSFNWAHVDSDIPQGMFWNHYYTCYALIIYHISKQSSVHLFADDCIIYHTINII